MTAHVGTTTEVPSIITDAGPRGLKLIRRLAIINLTLVALQPVSAGLMLSGYGRRAVTAHVAVAFALQFGALIHAIAAVVLWRRLRVPGSVAGFGLGLLVIVALEIGVGYSGRYWLHVPLGVGIFGALTRHMNRLGV